MQLHYTPPLLLRAAGAARSSAFSLSPSSVVRTRAIFCMRYSTDCIVLRCVVLCCNALCCNALCRVVQSRAVGGSEAGPKALVDVRGRRLGGDAG